MRSLKNYYFLSISLPELKLGAEPELSWQELLTLLNTNLSDEDKGQLEALLRYFDLCNMRSIWQKVPLGFLGNWSPQEIQTKLLDLEGCPKYLLNYLDKWPTDEERVLHFSELLKDYYEEEVKNKSPFLENYLRFERTFRIVTAFLRAKKRGLSFLSQIPFDAEDPVVGSLIQTLLDQEEKEEPQLPEPFEQLPRYFSKYSEDPKELDHAFDQLRFGLIHKEIDFDPFSINHVLGYVILFLMAKKEYLQRESQQDQFINEIIDEIGRKK